MNNIGENNPWLEGLSQVDDIEVIRQRAYKGSSPIVMPSDMSIDQRAGLLNSALSEIYIPTDSGCKILHMLIQRMAAYLRMRYPDIRDYRSQIHAKETEPHEESFLCLTGSAGVGKSCLISALQRLLPPRSCSIGKNEPVVRIDYSKRVKIHADNSELTILRKLMNPALAEFGGRQNLGDVVQHLVHWFYVCGVGQVGVDELQFMTSSENANARIAKLLLSLGYTGVPVVYVANYSLINKLMRRPQEERQRLLADHIVLQPDPVDSSSWNSLITEYVQTLPVTIKLDADKHGEELHHLTGGLPRLLRQLVLATYRHASTKYGGQVTLEAIRHTYRSKHFAMQRTDIEAMQSLSKSALLAKKRKDLVCPFTGDGIGEQALSVANTLISLPAAAQNQLESTLSPEARKTLKQFRESPDKVSQVKRKGTVTRMTKKTVTAESLYASLDAFQNEVSVKSNPTDDNP